MQDGSRSCKPKPLKLETTRIRLILANTHRLGVPSASTELEPAEMTTQGGGNHDSVGVLLKFCIWESFLDGNL